MEQNNTISKFVIVTGISGAGKSQAVHFLEDIGFFCVDNLPTALIPKFAELSAQSRGNLTKIALVIDIRERDLEQDFLSGLFSALGELEGMGFHYEILFFEARDEVLVRRYSETRRKHPLAKGEDLIGTIQAEREILSPIRERSTRIIDTSDLTVHELKEVIIKIYQDEVAAPSLTITIVAFGYKHGLPVQADLVFDVRFLPNPHFEADLRPLTGNDRKIVDFILNSPISQDFIKLLEEFVGFIIPQFMRERKVYLTIAIGCTGGKHRSVMIANQLGNYLRNLNYFVKIMYRDIEKE